MLFTGSTVKLWFYSSQVLTCVPKNGSPKTVATSTYSSIVKTYYIVIYRRYIEVRINEQYGVTTNPETRYRGNLADNIQYNNINRRGPWPVRHDPSLVGGSSLSVRGT